MRSRTEKNEPEIQERGAEESLGSQEESEGEKKSGLFFEDDSYHTCSGRMPSGSQDIRVGSTAGGGDGR